MNESKCGVCGAVLLEVKLIKQQLWPHYHILTSEELELPCDEKIITAKLTFDEIQRIKRVYEDYLDIQFMLKKKTGYWPTNVIEYPDKNVTDKLEKMKQTGKRQEPVE